MTYFSVYFVILASVQILSFHLDGPRLLLGQLPHKEQLIHFSWTALISRIFHPAVFVAKKVSAALLKQPRKPRVRRLGSKNRSRTFRALYDRQQFSGASEQKMHEIWAGPIMSLQPMQAISEHLTKWRHQRGVTELDPAAASTVMRTPLSEPMPASPDYY